MTSRLKHKKIFVELILNMSLTNDQIDAIVTRLATHEQWQKFSPEVQTKVLDQWHEQQADRVLDKVISAVEKESKKPRRRQAKPPKTEGNDEDDQ